MSQFSFNVLLIKSSKSHIAWAQEYAIIYKQYSVYIKGKVSWWLRNNGSVWRLGTLAVLQTRLLTSKKTSSENFGKHLPKNKREIILSTFYVPYKKHRNNWTTGLFTYGTGHYNMIQRFTNFFEMATEIKIWSAKSVNSTLHVTLNKKNYRRKLTIK